MFRALSTRRSDREYQPLANESSAGLSEAKLERATSLPAKILFGSSRKSSRQQELNFPAKKASKIHPLFGLFDARWRRKKPTAKPEFARYVEYMKEGGVWDVNSNVPVMYYYK
ncbi:Homeobox protein cut-like [Actinidia chinensis var. chinensis]|uniref:Homeobox protein cut-like n=1 Tax=Actinidia chinensis var. chinensis TaxID=1590841 RepID=A0A2R6PAN1_ACTCC|nr:Homeobox protein cut-like [Actinidia chinensis var. chinensis]